MENRFVLDGTTVEEVGQYHAKTVRLVVDQFNERVPILLQEEADRNRAVAEAEARHRREVEEQASRVRFDR